MSRGLRYQRGAVGALIIAILALVLVGIFAVYVFSEIRAGGDEAAQTQRRLASAAEALDAFAGTSSRLPCPADPTLDDGQEVRNPPGCQFPGGTLPWKTIGLKREDAYDAWGRKISYRVYTGASGSLAQDGGASMVYCDTQPEPGAGRDANGLCTGPPPQAATTRNTSPADFLLGKGMSLNDSGTANAANIAYVLISHGVTGFGGYTSTGARLDLPGAGGDERSNTEANPTFVIKAFSEPKITPDDKDHFDDVLVYRKVEDLVRRAGLWARDWPEAGAGALGITFNQGTVSTGAGSSVTSGTGIGTGTLSLPGAQVTGRDSGSGTSELSFVDSGSGVAGIGVSGGGDLRIQSSAGELLRIEFTDAFTKFALTLNEFGVYGSGYFEIVELRFYSGATQVGGSLFGFCNTASALSSFTFDVGAEYNRVDIVPVDSFNIFDGTRGITAFLVSEVKACAASETTCRTTLDDPANTFNTRCS